MQPQKKSDRHGAPRNDPDSSSCCSQNGKAGEQKHQPPRKTPAAYRPGSRSPSAASSLSSGCSFLLCCVTGKPWKSKRAPRSSSWPSHSSFKWPHGQCWWHLRASKVCQHSRNKIWGQSLQTQLTTGTRCRAAEPPLTRPEECPQVAWPTPFSCLLLPGNEQAHPAPTTSQTAQGDYPGTQIAQSLSR